MTRARDLLERYRRTGDTGALAAAVAGLESELAADPENRSELLTDLGGIWGFWYGATGRLEHYENAVVAHTAVLQITDVADRTLSRCHASWANTETTRARRESDLDRARSARQHADVAVDLATGSRDAESDARAAAASATLLLHQLGDETAALNDAVRHLRRSIEVTDPADPDWLTRRRNLATALSLRFEMMREKGDLDEAEALLTEVVRRTPPQSPELPDRIAALGGVLLARYQAFDDGTALERALERLRESVRIARGRERLLVGTDLATALLVAFGRHGRRAILDEGVDLLTGLEPGDDTADSAAALLSAQLGALLIVRYESFGAPEDLQAGLAALQRVEIADRLKGHEKTLLLSNLGSALLDQHQRVGSIELLEQAIGQLERACADRAVDHPVEREAMVNLAVAYLTHHELFGDLESVTAAVQVLDKVIAATGQQDSRRAGWLANQATAHQNRFQATNDADDLAVAVAALREAGERIAVAGTDPVAAPWADGSVLSNLAEALRLQAHQPGQGRSAQERLWAEATQALQQAVRLAVQNDQERALRLNNLGGLLLDQYDEEHEPEPLERAVATLEEAVTLTADDHPRRSVYLANLAGALVSAAELEAEPEATRVRARNLLAEAAHSPAGAPLQRIWAAYTGAQLAAGAGELDEALRAYGAAIALIPELTGRRISRQDREVQLAHLSQLARDAAACALQRAGPGDLVLALTLLEQG